MTTDDLREIEEALDDIRRSSSLHERVNEKAVALLALIREKLAAARREPPPAGTRQITHGEFEVHLHNDGTGTVDGLHFTMTWKGSGRVDKFVPVTDDAEHERAVEAWIAEATRISLHAGSACQPFQRLRDEGARLMRARPGADKAGELLRAAKDAVDLIDEVRAYYRNDWGKMGQLWDARAQKLAGRIEAAERAGVR